MLPIFVMADSGVDYEEAVHYTNNYIYSFDKYNIYFASKSVLIDNRTGKNEFSLSYFSAKRKSIYFISATFILLRAL
jgi:hypothetical protein